MKGCKRIEKNGAIRLCTFLRQRRIALYPGPQTLNSLSTNLEIPFVSLCSTGSIPTRVWSDYTVTFPSNGRNDLPQGFVNTCQKKQSKASEQCGNDALLPESKCDGSPNYRDGWHCVVNPVGRQISNHALLNLLNQGGNPPLHLGRERAYPTLNVGG